MTALWGTAEFQTQTSALAAKRTLGNQQADPTRSPLPFIAVIAENRGLKTDTNGRGRTRPKE